MRTLLKLLLAGLIAVGSTAAALAGIVVLSLYPWAVIVPLGIGAAWHAARGHPLI